ncbi:MAG: cupin domain-containing protein [Enhydrobacter sp.]|nr:cupin domain-containing protein [Enhydrobacter sp.]
MEKAFDDGIVRGQRERHPRDELLYVVQGSVNVTVLLEEGADDATLNEGSVFVVPAGRWHRQESRSTVSLMFVTPAEGSDASWSEDPRLATKSV